LVLVDGIRLHKIGLVLILVAMFKFGIKSHETAATAFVELIGFMGMVAVISVEGGSIGQLRDTSTPQRDLRNSFGLEE
jgi:hypothetical protein